MEEKLLLRLMKILLHANLLRKELKFQRRMRIPTI